ncbi:MAG: hypothetical protein AAF664_09420 [Planctomycetota bacterium]
MSNPYEAPETPASSVKVPTEAVHYKAGCWMIAGLGILLIVLLVVCAYLFAEEDGGVFFFASLFALFFVSALAISSLRGVELSPASRLGYSLLFSLLLGVLGIFSTVILLAAVCFGAIALSSSGVIDDADIGSTYFAILIPSCVVLGVVIASFAVARVVRAIVASNQISSFSAVQQSSNASDGIFVAKEAEELKE